jgi:transposase InsO family protein
MALIDSGAQDNYISKEVVARAGLTPYPKKHPYTAVLADKSMKQIRHEVCADLSLTPGQTHRVKLDVFETAAHDIILGLPWLRDHNPDIDWKNQRVSLGNTTDARTPKVPVQTHAALADEKTIKNIASQPTVPKNKKKKRSRHKGVNSAERLKVSASAARKGEKSVTPNIPEVYKEFINMFIEKEGMDALPKHQPWDLEIELQEGKYPGFEPIYKLSEKELEVLKKYIEDSLAKGFIRKSKSSAGYPVLFAPKKDGTLRPCVDYRKLNAITVKNRYPLPNIQELRDRLSRAKIFTALDLRGAYHLIRIKKGHEWKTAFRTRYGHYEYQVVPFGLTNAPAACQDLINSALNDCLDQYAIAYLDDILIYSDNMEEHVQHVKEVLQRLRAHHLELKPEKCEFHKEEVEFLGHMVGVNGVRISEAKIKTIKEWETPKTVKDVQSFLGFVNFNRQFIRDFAKIAIPLTKLTKKETTWRWGESQQEAFEKLKLACITEPVLVAFRSGEPLRFETDASDLAMGGAALQERDGKWHPVAYYSKKFSSAEERYDVHDKELLAIVYALEHWRVYAESCSDLTIFTDHKNLQYFTTTKQLNRRQVRWSELLGQYQFKIVYTPGKDNGRADALSRRHDVVGKKTNVFMPLLQQNKDGSLGPSKEVCSILRITHEVPEELQAGLIRSYHDDPVYGHPGITRTMELIRRNYEFKNMKDKVTDFIKKCADCQRNKHSTHAEYGEMQAIELPTEPWTDISMDFVTGLPESKDPTTGLKYDAILVVVDRFTKAAEYIPFRKNYTAEQLGHVLKDRVFRYHGIPKTIISDRDKLFTSNYWATLMAAIGTQRKLSTAYHPQTDGQTERTNRTMKTYLRIYANEKQDNWVSLLPMAQMAYNNKISESTGKTPFFANHGRHPHLFEKVLPGPNAEAAVSTAEEMKKTHEEMLERIKKAQQQSISHVNKKRKTAPQLKRGDKVYLLTKNLRTTRPSKGLDHVKVGPFLIRKKNGPVNYTLDLPEDAKIHPRFHVNKLEPADPETPLQKTFHYETEEENEFEVEDLLDYREIGRQDFQSNCFIQEWLVKWKGYPHSENTWEPESNLQNCQQILKKARKKFNAHYYTKYSPERMQEAILKQEINPDNEILRYLVNKGLSIKAKQRRNKEPEQLHFLDRYQ